MCVVFISCFVVLRWVILCCVVSAVLCCVALCCVAIRCVVLPCVVIHYVVLRCIVLCFVALRCVAIRCVTLELRCFLLRCVASWSVVLHCLVLCCVVDKFSISSIPPMLKLYISRQTQSTSLTGRQSLHQRTRQTQPPLTTFTYCKTAQTPLVDQLDKLHNPHSLADKISSSQHNWTNTTNLAKQTNLTIPPQREQLVKVD